MQPLIINFYLKRRSFEDMSHDMKKNNKMSKCPVKTQISLGITQSDQSLCCALNASLRTQGFFMQTAKTLIRLGRCPGWSETSLGAHSFCWFCHAAAHIENIHTSSKTAEWHYALTRNLIFPWREFKFPWLFLLISTTEHKLFCQGNLKTKFMPNI